MKCSNCKNCEPKMHPADGEIKDYCVIAKDYIDGERTPPTVCANRGDYAPKDAKTMSLF